MCPYMPWGEETRAQLHAAFQVGRRLGSRVVGIGSRSLRGLLYLSESDNFFVGTLAVPSQTGFWPLRRLRLSKWVVCRGCQSIHPLAKLDSLHRSHDNFRRFLGGALLAPNRS